MVDDATKPGLVATFHEGNREQVVLLGGKGAGLAEMVRLGLPVPPGFTVTTAACHEYERHGGLTPELLQLVHRHLEQLQSVAGRRLGDVTDPLLVSVRSGSAVSMPGMMDTVLNLGLTREAVPGLAEQTGDEPFAWASYVRLLRMYGEIVLSVPGHVLSSPELSLPAPDAHMADALEARILAETGREVPQDPLVQLEAAIGAVFDSWHSRRAQRYRRHHGIDDGLGTAATVQAMVFGNRGQTSATGVAFTRHPSIGSRVPFGDVLPDAQGEDVVAGIRPTRPLAELDDWLPACGQRLRGVMTLLEGHYRDMCDIEFTIEQGELWLLQTRIGKRTARAAVRIAVALVDEGIIDEAEAVRRVPRELLAQAQHTHLVIGEDDDILALGVAASPGAARGQICLDPDDAEALADEGVDVILVRRETSPHDLHGMLAARGIVTCVGGPASHAAVVARDVHTPAVVGASAISIDRDRNCLLIGDREIHEGTVISIDGATGQIVLGAPTIEEPAPDEDADRMSAFHRAHAQQTAITSGAQL